MQTGMVSTTILMAALVCGGASHASAQSSEEPDFLFGAPRGALSLRGGLFLASASSDIYDFLGEELTIEKSNFHAPVFGVDVAFAVLSRVDVLAGFEYTRSGVDSEYRDFVEDNGDPILQRTDLKTVPVTGSVKVYLSPRGRSISRFAFVPTKARAYAGGGAGVIWYRLTQFGDFVDFVDLSIFPGEFFSSGWGTEAHVFGGMDLQMSPKWYLSFEGRYVWANARLAGDFVGFDPIDLGGLRITAGASFSF